MLCTVLPSLTRQQLKDYITTHYTAPRMVVAGAGAIDHSHLVDLSSQVSLCLNDVLSS